jgi:hypothetical protein
MMSCNELQSDEQKIKDNLCPAQSDDQANIASGMAVVSGARAVLTMCQEVGELLDR